MNEEIGSYDAKTKLPEILRRVEAAIANILKATKHTISGEELDELKQHDRK